MVITDVAFHLRHDDWEADLLPALGGAIGGLRKRGRAILRPTPPGAIDPLQTSCFPLVPYANRIAHGRFTFAEQEHQLPRNFGDHPHSLHGVGWKRPWSVTDAGAAHATLELHHKGGADWPWPFLVRQHLTLGDDGMVATLSMANLAQETVPAGLGFHPYFPIDAHTVLRFIARQMWLTDETQLPTVAGSPDRFADWSAGAAVADLLLIDNSYEGWAGTATLTSSDGETRIRAAGAKHLHLFIPPGDNFLCVEPVSHLPDTFNRRGPFATIQPGASMVMEMHIVSD